MSREPSSPLHRSWQYHEKVQPPPPAPTKPKPGPPRKYKVLVSPPRERREQAMNKLLTTTEALTPVERAAVQRYRARIDIEKEND
jgi:hypothetical protein